MGSGGVWMTDRDGFRANCASVEEVDGVLETFLICQVLFPSSL